MLLGLVSCPSTDACPLAFIDQCGEVEGGEVTGTEGSLEREVGI